LKNVPKNNKQGLSDNDHFACICIADSKPFDNHIIEIIEVGSQSSLKEKDGSTKNPKLTVQFSDTFAIEIFILFFLLSFDFE
jgi:hypothetical protein